MYRAGASGLRRYPLLALSVYAVQLVLSTAAAWTMARLLAAQFAYYPMFDRAVDGDTVSLLLILNAYPRLIFSLFWIGLAAAILYGMISWFLTGGLIAVYRGRPTERRATAETFGSGGAASFFAFARLAAWNAGPKLLGLIIVLFAVGVAADQVTEASTVSSLLGTAIGGSIPGLLILWLAGTAGDYARVDLVNHPGQSSLRALFRGYKKIATDWRPLLHSLSYWLFFGVITIAFVAATYDAAMGAMALLMVRQLVAVSRFSGKLVLLGGQVELGSAMSPPRPRRLRRPRG
jgi:hypothetical protein